MINGVVVVRKEKGMTSFDVVARLRRLFGQKKIGHTGTLDPDAEGVLVVCVGRATKLVDDLSDGTKTYEAVLLLGQITDTQDISGKILEEHEVYVTPDEVCEAILSFEGKQLQMPPMYSAIKIGGKKLVDLARKGKVVDRTPREVEFSDFVILENEPPRIRFRVTCSKGASTPMRLCMMPGSLSTSTTRRAADRPRDIPIPRNPTTYATARFCRKAWKGCSRRGVAYRVRTAPMQATA